jgi:hypothetical protein
MYEAARLASLKGQPENQIKQIVDSRGCTCIDPWAYISPSSGQCLGGEMSYDAIVEELAEYCENVSLDVCVGGQVYSAVSELSSVYPPTGLCAQHRPSSLVALCGYGPLCGAIDVEVSLLTDDYPSETSWEIFDDANYVVVNSGSGFIEKWKEYKGSVCLPVGTCYQFVIKDTAGDGICCDYGDGSYQLRNSRYLFSEGGYFCSSASSGTFGTCDQEPVTPSSALISAPSLAPLQERSEKPSSPPVGFSFC